MIICDKCRARNGSIVANASTGRDEIIDVRSAVFKHPRDSGGWMTSVDLCQFCCDAIYANVKLLLHDKTVIVSEEEQPMTMGRMVEAVIGPVVKDAQGTVICWRCQERKTPCKHNERYCLECYQWCQEYGDKGVRIKTGY